MHRESAAQKVAKEKNKKGKASFIFGDDGFELPYTWYNR